MPKAIGDQRRCGRDGRDKIAPFFVLIVPAREPNLSGTLGGGGPEGAPKSAMLMVLWVLNRKVPGLILR